SLASCVAETVMTGLAGGGHAAWFDAGRGKGRLLDFFVAVPGLGAEPSDAEPFELPVPFGTELVHYAIGIASCAVPRGVAGRSEADRAVALVEALGAADRAGHTTNLVAVDEDENACVVTTSLGLGSGDFLPGLDVHLNSMLGERDLIVGPLVPGERMESMMA